MRYRNVALPLAILSIGAIVETAIACHFSVDARGWWPLILGMSLLQVAAYSFAFGLVAGDRRLSSIYIVVLNGLFAATKVYVCCAYYAISIARAAAYPHLIELTPLQQAIRSNWSVYLMPLPFLIAHLALARTRLASARAQRPPREAG